MCVCMCMCETHLSPFPRLMDWTGCCGTVHLDCFIDCLFFKNNIVLLLIVIDFEPGLLSAQLNWCKVSVHQFWLHVGSPCPLPARVLSFLNLENHSTHVERQAFPGLALAAFAFPLLGLPRTILCTWTCASASNNNTEMSSPGSPTGTFFPPLLPGWSSCMTGRWVGRIAGQKTCSSVEGVSSCWFPS